MLRLEYAGNTVHLREEKGGLMACEDGAEWSDSGYSNLAEILADLHKFKFSYVLEYEPD